MSEHMVNTAAHSPSSAAYAGLPQPHPPHVAQPPATYYACPPAAYPGGYHAALPPPPQSAPMPATSHGGYYYVPPPPMIPAQGGGSYVYVPPQGSQAPAPLPAMATPPAPAPFPPVMSLRVGTAPLSQGVPGALPSAVLKMQAGQATFGPPKDDNLMSVEQGVHEKATQLRVHHLGRDTTPSEFADLFDPFGLVNLVRIVKHKDTHTPRGYGFVYFRDHASALAAVEAAQKRTFMINGQALEVGFADPQRPLSRRALAHVAFRMRKKQQLEDEAAAAEGTPRSGSVTGSDGMPRMITDATEFRTTSPSSASATAAGSGHGSDSEEQEELSRRLRESLLGLSPASN